MPIFFCWVHHCDGVNNIGLIVKGVYSLPSLKSSMARGEGDQPAHIQSHFVDRVSRLPVVGSAWDLAQSTYGSLKGSSRLVHFTLTNAERTATFVVGQARPVVLKFERQIQVVDDLACKGLVSLEEKVPFIKKPTEEIIDETRKMYTDSLNSRLEGIKKYGNDTVKSAADFGLRRANALFGPTLVQTVLTSVDGVLVVTQNYIDHILPPTREESQSNGKKEDKDSQSGLVRLTRLSNTVRRRAIRALSLKVESAQEIGIELFLSQPIRLIEITKTNMDAAIEYANKLWVAIRRQEVEETDSNDKTRVEQQLLLLARLVSRQVATAYSSFSLASTAPQETSQLQSVGLVAARDGVLWVIGMLRVMPSLLPMYIYGLLSWIDEQRHPREEETIKKKTGDEVTPKTNGVRNNHSNHSNHEEDKNHSSDDSIPEEDEEY